MWPFYQIIGISFINCCLIKEKEISNIVMMKQDLVKLEAVMRYFKLKENTIDPMLIDKEK